MMKIQFCFQDNCLQYWRYRRYQCEWRSSASCKVKEKKHCGASWSPLRRSSFITVSGWLKMNDKNCLMTCRWKVRSMRKVDLRLGHLPVRMPCCLFLGVWMQGPSAKPSVEDCLPGECWQERQKQTLKWWTKLKSLMLNEYLHLL